MRFSTIAPAERGAEGTSAGEDATLCIFVHKYGNEFRQIRPSGAKGNKPGVSEANPRVVEEQRCAPRQWLQELPAPLPGRIRILQYSGGSLRSPPAKLPAPFPGRPGLSGEYVTVFMKSCTQAETHQPQGRFLVEELSANGLCRSIHCMASSLLEISPLKYASTRSCVRTVLNEREYSAPST